MKVPKGHILYEIPIKPHLFAFISNFGNTEPYMVNTKDLFGRILIQNLDNPLNFNRAHYNYDYPVMKVCIPIHLLERKRHTILTKSSIKSINKYLNDFFYFTFLEYVKLRQQLSEEMKTHSIDAFMNYYNMDSNVVNKDTLVKYLYRNF